MFAAPDICDGTTHAAEPTEPTTAEQRGAFALANILDAPDDVAFLTSIFNTHDDSNRRN